jgi:hypothetical protein
MTIRLALSHGQAEHRCMDSAVVIICFAALGILTIAQFVYAIWEYENHHH